MSLDLTKISPPQSLKKRLEADRKELEKQLVGADGVGKLKLELWGIELDITEEVGKGVDRNRDRIRDLQEGHRSKTKEIAGIESGEIIKKDKAEAEAKKSVNPDA